jgi:signal transduction histidine kinase
MNETEAAHPSERKLAFFGSISASLSHELRNVITIISEVSGLMEDIAGLAARGKKLDPDRIRTLCGKIGDQARRGEALLDRMNRFSHNADGRRMQADLKEDLNDICDLCNRFAALKEVRLVKNIPDRSAVLSVDPFALQYAVFLCIEMALVAAAEKREITVTWAERDAAHEVSIASGDPLKPELEGKELLATLQAVMNQIGGDCDWAAEQGGTRFRLTIR